MKILLLLALSFLSSFSVNSSVDENDLPVYLRGIGWRNVEEVLKKDLRLSHSVHPTHYDLNLDVSVSGYGNANKSIFDGTVSIALDITASTSEIELHCLGLDINSVKLSILDSTGEEKDTLSDNNFSINDERESIVISSKRSIRPGESVALTIAFNGTARMNGVGFYESWNQRDNMIGLPYISLLTQFSPTQARRWFPCFDEPDKKATFQLTVTHPKETSAYSNTQIFSESAGDGKRTINFERTVPLPTYLYALAITEQPAVGMTVNGYEFRGIGKNGEDAVETASAALKKLQNHSIFDGVPFIPKKTDILLVEDYNIIAMEYPGLITINSNHTTDFEAYLHELAHMYFGDLVSPSTWGDIWVKEGFATLYHSHLKPEEGLGLRSFNGISLYDRPLHADHTYTSSLYLYNSFFRQSHIHYKRGSQFLRMTRKYMGPEVFDSAIKKYLLENKYGNGDSTKIIKYLLNEYDENRTKREELQAILGDWIYKSGVAVVFMERREDRVTFTQKRFHSSYFNKELRDEKTKFTIPLFCELNGEPRTIVLKSDVLFTSIAVVNSTFTCENDYGDLYGIWSKLRELPKVEREIIDWLFLTLNLFRDGLINAEEFSGAISPFAENDIVNGYLQYRISRDNQAKRTIDCQGKKTTNTSLNDLYAKYIRDSDLSIFFCSNEARNRTSMIELLHKKLISDELKIRSIDLVSVIKSIELLHPGATMDFVMEEFKMKPSSLQLRFKMKDIITAVYPINRDHTALHEFIRLYPSIAAESYDPILLTLEEIYLMDEFDRKDKMLKEIIKKILEKGAANKPKVHEIFSSTETNYVAQQSSLCIIICAIIIFTF